MSDSPRVARAAAQPPTLEDVARVAGVSRATVSRVVNGTRNVDPALQETVMRAVASTGYVPNSAARSLVTRRAGVVALVVCGVGGGEQPDGYPSHIFADPFFGRVISGVVGHLRPHGTHPVLMLVETEEERARAVGYLRQGNVDGALLVPIDVADPLPELVTAAGLPAVRFARPPRPLPISYVDLAHQDGAGLAADRLVARGCRRVVTLSGPLDVPAGQDRLLGFQQAMARHGHPYVPAAEGNFTEASGETAMRGLLAEVPALDGVFAGNDLMARGALRVLREAGRRVPEDVAVVGFDDSSAATAEDPALTTVRQPVEDMAAEMTRLLLDLVASPEREPASVIFEPTLVVRASA